MSEYRKFLSLGHICLLLTAVILVAALWPFNFIPTNNASWLPKEKGVQFTGQGIVYSAKPLVLQASELKDPGLTIIMVLRPDRDIQEHVDTILTFYDQGRELFLISQRKTNFGIRVPADGVNSKDPYRYMGIGNLFQETDRTYYITVSSGHGVTDVYADGDLKQSVRGTTLLAKEKLPYGTLILGNSPNGIHPWKGSFYGLAVYDRALNGSEVRYLYNSWRSKGPASNTAGKNLAALYLFDEQRGELIRDHSGSGNQLLMPKVFEPLQRTVLHFPGTERLAKIDTWLDIALNVFGFMPFGFIVYAWLRESNKQSHLSKYIIAIVLGFSLSLTIELAQILLPTRDSSSLDLLTNTLGTALGIVLYRYLSPYLHNTIWSR